MSRTHPTDAAARLPEPRIVTLPDRLVASIAHHGPVASIDDTRRPLYRHMIIHELVGGPSIIRFLDHPKGDHHVDALVLTHQGFEGDAVCNVETLHGGRHAVLDFEGPPSGLAAARQHLQRWAARHGHTAAGPVLQVHLMDEIDGVVEEQLQLRLA